MFLLIHFLAKLGWKRIGLHAIQSIKTLKINEGWLLANFVDAFTFQWKKMVFQK